ncbi:hypothetical protein CKAH01_16426 [Colletotrichum kahawae]|uniref:Uncharacterized protein n=1 Tax=Colletotrichum kahawae TaxID=34407 RepID=A0AAD9YG48_COLKA|nr:hypothetical protein CKAH01_16426 [Colletotrichum kahawae]
MDNRLSATHRENINLKAELERLRRENAGLVGMDETYNMRLVNQERSHAKHIENLTKSLTKSLTKQLEDEREQRKRLEERLAQMDMQTRRQSRSSLPRVEATQQTRSNFNAPENGSGLGIRMRPQTHPMPQTAVRPPPRPVAPSTAAPFRPAVARIPSEQAKAWLSRNPAVMQSIPTTAIARTTDSPTPNPQTPPSAALPSRSSASRLPILAKIPSTPRTSTPTLARDPSLTDSTQASMTSSIFSRRSFDTTTEAAPTPPAASPVIKKETFDMAVREVPTAPADEAPSPVLSIPPTFSSVLPSPRTATIDLASVAGSEMSQEGLAAIDVPSLQSSKSWAAVAGQAKGLARIVIGSPSKATQSVAPTAPASFGRGRNRDRTTPGSAT